MKNGNIKEMFGRCIVCEDSGYGDKVRIVTDFLDNNFIKVARTAIGDNGFPETKGYVKMVDSYKNPINGNLMSDIQLFYLIQDKFKGIIVDKNERDKFLKQCIKDWYGRKVSKYGSLSKY